MSVSSLYFAAVGNLSKLKKSIASGIHVDAQNEQGETALFFAALYGRQKTAKALLEMGANPSKKTKYGRTPMDASAWNDHYQTLELLLKHDKGSRVSRVSAKLERSSFFRSRDISIANDSNQKIKTLDNSDAPIGTLLSIEPSLLSLSQNENEKMERPFIGYWLRNGKWCRTDVTVKGSLQNSVGWNIKQELEWLRKLQHPHIIKLLATSMDKYEELTLLLEPSLENNLFWICYKNTRSICRPETKFGISLPTLVRHISLAVEYLHSNGILHNFINPHSITCASPVLYKLCNFNYCSSSSNNEVSQNLNIAHYPWMAPSVMTGEAVTTASDVYSFGTVIWELMAETLPWSWKRETDPIVYAKLKSDPLPLLLSWPRPLCNLVRLCTAVSSSDRPTFEEILTKWNDIEDVLNNQINSSQIEKLLDAATEETLVPCVEDEQADVWEKPVEDDEIRMFFCQSQGKRFQISQDVLKQSPLRPNQREGSSILQFTGSAISELNPFRVALSTEKTPKFRRNSSTTNSNDSFATIRTSYHTAKATSGVNNGRRNSLQVNDSRMLFNSSRKICTIGEDARLENEDEK